MSIVSSTYRIGHAQRDGRRYVTETHLDSKGVARLVEYLAPVDADYAEILAARAQLIAARLAEAEIEALLSG